MTISTHVYTAKIQGAPPRALSVRGGQIVLDEGRAPHVTADLTTAIPNLATLAALDTRLSPAPRMTVTADVATPWGTQTRAFDLTVRRRRVLHAAGVVQLALSSDEGLLDDYRPLADDETPYRFGTSLRSVVNYVLAKAIPGAALEASPALDADVTPWANSTNLIPDPSLQGDGSIYVPTNASADKVDTSWAASGTRSLNIWNPTALDSFVSIGGDNGALRLGMTPGKTYVFSATGRVKATVSASALDRARRLVAFTGAGAIIETRSDPLPTTVGAVARVSVRFTVPEGATAAFVRAYNGHASGQVQWDAFRLSEYTGDPTDTAYYDGSTPPTPGYSYAWAGPVNNSVSIRTALVNRSIDLLRWQAGDAALAFLAPIVQAAGFRLVCDELRKWTLRDESYEAPGALQIRHAVNLIDADDDMSRDDDTWCDAAVVVYTWLDKTGTQRQAVDSFALTAAPSRVVTIERTAPYPGPGLAAYIVRRAQGRGRQVSATTVADWTARAEQPVQIVLDGAPTQIGKTSRVEFDLDRDEVTVATRTTDTPPSAWALIPTGQRWIDSPAGASWTSEEI